MVSDIESQYYSMGLTENQEFVITKLMQSAVESSLSHNEMGGYIDLELNDIIDTLAKIAQKQ